MVTAMDTIVGATVSALKETGMYNNSIIIYTSDNGGPAKMSNNLPLRGAFNQFIVLNRCQLVNIGQINCMQKLSTFLGNFLHRR